MPELKSAMVNVVDEGTAKVVHRDDMKIAAKTGTAQVGSKEHHRQIAWLNGYLPADNPQYAFSIMVEGTFADNLNDTLEGGLLGGRDAGAIAKAIFDQIYPVPGKKKKETPIASAKDKTAGETASADAATPPAPANTDSPAPPAAPAAQ
jgi:penicillin-binding protein 2